MTANEALEVLGLPPGSMATLSDKQVKTAFRRLVREIHSDVTGEPTDAARMNDLVQARGVLLLALDNICPRCAGRGFIRTHSSQFVANTECPKCDGTGETI